MQLIQVKCRKCNIEMKILAVLKPQIKGSSFKDVLKSVNKIEGIFKCPKCGNVVSVYVR